MFYVEPYLSGDDSAHIEQVFDDLGLGTGISLDGVEPLVEFVTLGLELLHGIETRATSQRSG